MMPSRRSKLFTPFALLALLLLKRLLGRKKSGVLETQALTA